MDDVNLFLDRHRREHGQGGNHFKRIHEAILIRIKQNVQVVAILALVKERRKLAPPECKPANIRVKKSPLSVPLVITF